MTNVRRVGVVTIREAAFRGSVGPEPATIRDRITAARRRHLRYLSNLNVLACNHKLLKLSRRLEISCNESINVLKVYTLK
jgi:hypothetical protein